MLKINILYFAWVRENIGLDSETIEVPAGVLTVVDLLDWLATRSPRHAAALADRTQIRVAIDQQFAQNDALVECAVEIAIFPPVTGG